MCPRAFRRLKFGFTPASSALYQMYQVQEEVDIKRVAGKWTPALCDNASAKANKVEFSYNEAGDLMIDTFAIMKFHDTYKRVGEPLAGHFQLEPQLCCFCLPPMVSQDVFILDTDYDRYMIYVVTLNQSAFVFVLLRDVKLIEDEALMNHLQKIACEKGLVSAMHLIK